MNAQLEWDLSTSLVDRLLEEQRTLTAVDEFSADYEGGEHREARYEALIPSTLPGRDEQYAFRVDLDSCTGCKACVTACHSLNGLDEDEAWRRVGLTESRTQVDADILVGSISAGVGLAVESSHQQTVTTACHHCEEPGCLAGCPVQAYEKDSTTGIVRHLDDQCIGCRYCQLMCPYDVPTFSERLGIVRKCDMCQDRLAEGEAPACVQGCPNEAISIDVVATSGGKGGGADDRLLMVSPGAMPESSHTRPSTRYVSLRPVESAVDPVDLSKVSPSEGHTPLAIMLVLTQVAIGGLAAEVLMSFTNGRPESQIIASVIVLTCATLFGLAGLGASFLHIGRPQWAFRAFLGLRTSWMSREIIVLGAFAGLLVGAFLLAWVDWAVEAGLLSGFWERANAVRPMAGALAVGTGLLGLFCSIQIYAITGRPLWRLSRTAWRFGSTAVWAGVALAQLGVVASGGFAAVDSVASQTGLALALIGITLLRLRSEAGGLVESDDQLETIALARTRQLLQFDLKREATMRRQLLQVAGVVLPLVQIVAALAHAPLFLRAAVAGTVLLVGVTSDLLERSLFFRSEAMPSMPGIG